ncbi:MAG: DUF4097 family beta strand repeat protein [Bacteroidales bacterium]|nr:DUF4097 family beta strand repeat protein [Bacteroidales bacterium]
MKTKTIIKSSLILLLALLLTGSVFSAPKGDFTKPIKKEFNIDKGATLNINCEFSDIKAFNWNKDIISIEVNITVDAKNEDKAADKFDNVIVELSGNTSEVKLRTGIESSFFGNNNNNIDVEVVIYYPSHIQLELNTEFGNSIFEDIEGKVNIELDYGNFTAHNLTNTELNLDVEFGQIEVNRFQAGEVEVSYGGFTSKVAGALKLESAFSSNEIDQVEHLELSSAYDKIFIGQANIALIETEFSNLRIDQLNSHLKLETAYGSFRLGKIATDFEMIDINAEFTGVELSFTENASFAFQVTMDMGDFKYPKDQMHITKLEKEMMELYLEGYMGNAKGSAPKVILDVEHANAKIQIQ